MREMGRWSEDQLRDFLDIKGESHGNLRTHAELLRTAVDAETGRLCPDFGDAGILDVNQWNKPDANFPLSQLQPPTVTGDTLIMGWAGKDWYDAENPLGSVFAVDARTGKVLRRSR